jgi:hypothetical protein
MSAYYGKVCRVLQRLGDKVREFRSPRAALIPHEWLKHAPDLHGKEVCLFVTYAPEARLDPVAEYHARAWANQGFTTILIVNADGPAAFARNADFPFAAGVLLRRNAGFDFGAWSTAILELPGLRGARIAVMANDSLYGPFCGFDRIVDRFRRSPADFIGAIESIEIERHYQSFIFAFSNWGLNQAAFWRFWRRVRLGELNQIIGRYEVRMLSYFRRHGYRTDALIPIELSQAPVNRTLTSWRELIEAGFPFLKRRLSRTGPPTAGNEDWCEFIMTRGYDPRLLLCDKAGDAPASTSVS